MLHPVHFPSIPLGLQRDPPTFETEIPSRCHNCHGRSVTLPHYLPVTASSTVSTFRLARPFRAASKETPLGFEARPERHRIQPPASECSGTSLSCVSGIFLLGARDCRLHLVCTTRDLLPRFATSREHLLLPSPHTHTCHDAPPHGATRAICVCVKSGSGVCLTTALSVCLPDAVSVTWGRSCGTWPLFDDSPSWLFRVIVLGAGQEP